MMLGLLPNAPGESRVMNDGWPLNIDGAIDSSISPPFCLIYIDGTCIYLVHEAITF
jgi:hypothetical protein